jgi:hypothetical protein
MVRIRRTVRITKPITYVLSVRFGSSNPTSRPMLTFNGREMNSEPAMRADIEVLEHRLEGKLDASEQPILDRVGEMIRDSETKLLPTI